MQFVIHSCIFFGSGGVEDSKTFWDFNLCKISERTEWLEIDREKQALNTIRFISDILYQAKIDDINKLKNMPIEVIFEKNLLKSWRILTEVL